MEEPQEQVQEQSDTAGRKKAIVRIAIGVIAVVALIAIGVYAVRGHRVAGEGGIWYAFTDYGTEQRLVLSSDKTARLGTTTGIWAENASGDAYLVRIGGEGTVDFKKNGDNLEATIEAISPEKDDSSPEGTDEEQLVFYPAEDEARSDYDARLASWKQELADYEAELTQALVGGWQRDMRKTANGDSVVGSDAIVFSDDGTYRLAHETIGYRDSWTGKCKSEVKSALGTWKIDESEITDVHMKFFREHIGVKVSKAKKFKNVVMDTSYRKVSLGDKNDPASVQLGKKSGWEKAQGNVPENPAKLVKSIRVSSATGDSHKKTLVDYFGPDADSPDDSDGGFANYDFDADGSNDTLSYHLDPGEYSDGHSVKGASVSIGGSSYSLKEEGWTGHYFDLGLLTMDNGANFVYAKVGGDDGDGPAVLLQYRDGELAPVAANGWLGDNVRHPGLESVTTSGNTVNVTFVGQPISTGIMYFGYKLEYADGRLSRMGSTTDSLEYLSMGQTKDGSGSEPGVYKMKANKKVACYSDASSSSGIALTAKKGQKVTFTQVKTVDSRVWFHVKRARDGAEGWFPNGTEYEDPLPFAGFIQAG